MLPPSYGATPISTLINAQAAYIAGAGDFLESAANARMTNALAAEKEMDNSVKWVQTYFDRKELNRSYTKPPSYIERQMAINTRTKELIDSKYQIELKGDVTEKLNWILRELNSLAPAQRFTAGGKNSLVGGEVDVKLTRDDIHHVLFTDGGHANGRSLLFRADAAEALKARWPRVLRNTEFDEVRQLFEFARDDAIVELKATNELSQRTAQQLMDRVDDLCSAFNTAYPPKRRTSSIEAHTSFLAGKKYLQSLALGVFRMIETEDVRGFDGSYSFQGDSAAALVGHMHKFGLEFGPAQPGDEPVYRKLFFAMRAFLSSTW